VTPPKRFKYRRDSVFVRLRSLAPLALLAAPGQPAWGEVLGDPIDTAKALLGGGEREAARPYLEQALANNTGSVDALFLLGMLELSTGNYRTAIARFRQALVHEPKATRIRLELARAFYLDKDYENAFRQFQFARAGKPPAGVVASIDGYLAAIRQEKSWSYDFSIALAPDTNINNATSAREAVLFGLPFELDEAARRKSGVGLAVGGSAEFAPRIGSNLRLRLGGGGQRREYDGKAFDDTVVALHAGPRLILPRGDLSLIATSFRRWYGGQRLNEGLGARIEANSQLDGRTSVSLGLSGQHVRYPNSPDLTGLNFAARVNAIRALTPASSVTARLGLGRQKARADHQANWSGTLGVGYYRDLAGGFSIYVEPSLSYVRYDAVDPFFFKRRRDLGQELQVAVLNRRIVQSRFTPRITYTFARRRGTIDLFQFSQSRVEMGVTSRF
jgi:outer membrane protein